MIPQIPSTGSCGNRAWRFALRTRERQFALSRQRFVATRTISAVPRSKRTSDPDRHGGTSAACRGCASAQDCGDHALRTHHLVRANPNKVNYGSGGAGTTHHLAGELFKLM